GDGRRGADEIEIEEHAVRRVDTARGRGRDDRRRPGRLCRQGRESGPHHHLTQSRIELDRRDEHRERALKDLQELEVLMIDGHFDYGNGYHGRVYLNPHQLFRHPSTIWRFAQDLIDVLPTEIVQATEVVAGPATGGALLAHTIAGLFDSRRSLTHPPCSFAPIHYDPSTSLGASAGEFTLRPLYAR